MKMRLLALCALGLSWSVAQAQLLPPVLPPLPPLPVEAPVAAPVAPLVRTATGLPAVVVRSARAQARVLLRRHADHVERDPRGAPVVRAVIVALSPDTAALAQAIATGFSIDDDRTLPVLDQRVVTLRAPAGLGIADALRRLREADPAGQYDFDHFYVESGEADAVPIAAAVARGPLPAAVPIGLIDGGVDTAHPVFQRNPPRQSGCTGRSVPSVHGTAVASLLVGWTPQFAGAAPGATLHAYDVYCGDAAPGGRMRDVVSGMAELAAGGARVINLSIVGPDNTVLAAVVRALLARSIVLVAASGNDGPTAAPLYPAAYAGVIAVSAVDARLRVLAEASGGAHVRFAAPGADMVAAAPGGEYAAVRGTSFAAPLVAGLLARALVAQPAADAEQLALELAATAQDRGAKGRDPRYGEGLVAAELRVDPRGFAARPTR